MDTEEQSTSYKRKQENEIVDPDDGSVLTTAKKSRIEPNLVKKVKCLKFIIDAFLKIKVCLPQTLDPDCANITLGNQILNIIFTSFNILRQRVNGTTSNSDKKASLKKSFTITSKGRQYPISVEKAIQSCQEAAIAQDLQFKRYDPRDQENWYGTVSPYLDFFAGNQLRLVELRIGHSMMPMSKDGDRSRSFPVEKYGLNGSHHILLEGCTFPPEKRTSMAQSLGPLTVLLCHIRSDERYRKKWTEAAKRAMSHIPIIDEILDIVRGRNASEVRGVIGLLADILLITTSRQAQRMFFPINILVRLYKYPIGPGGYMIDASSGRESNVVGGDNLLRGFNVSGNGGFYLYHVATEFNWEMEGTFTELDAKQVLFHTIFGTYKEDLSVLEQITNLGIWSTREQFGNRFQKMSMCGSAVTFKPIKLNVYAKLTSANQTGLLSTTYLQTSSLPVFSGKRIQNFTEGFFEQISRRTGNVSTAKTIPQITATLTDILAELRQGLLNGGKKLSLGTVSWRTTEGMDILAGGAESNLLIEGTCKFFLGRS